MPWTNHNSDELLANATTRSISLLNNEPLPAEDGNNASEKSSEQIQNNEVIAENNENQSQSSKPENGEQTEQSEKTESAKPEEGEEQTEQSEKTEQTNSKQ